MHNLLFLFHHVIKRVSVLGKQDNYWNKWQNQRLNRKYPLSFGWCWTKCTKSICNHMSRTCCCVPRASSFTYWIVWKKAVHEGQISYAHNHQNMVWSFIGWLTYRLPFSLSGLASRIPLNVLRNHHQKLAGLNLALSLPEIIALFNYVNMTPCCFYNIINVIPVIWYMAKYHSLPLTVKLEDRLPTRWLFWIHQVNGKFISKCRCLYT